MPQKIFDNDLVAIRKNKITLMLNKPAYIRMRILELCKVLMYKFYYDYITNKYGNNSRLLFTDTYSLISEIKTYINVCKDFSNNKEIFDFSNYSTMSKYFDISNKLVVRKMKNEIAGVTIEEFFGLKPKMYLYLVDDNSDHKKAKGINKNVVAILTRNENKDFLLN